MAIITHTIDVLRVGSALLLMELMFTFGPLPDPPIFVDHFESVQQNRP